MQKISNYFINAVKNYAVNNWRLYSFKQEWLSIIILVAITKLITSVISIFSGFYYLDSVFYGLFNSEGLSKFFSCFGLVLIEGLNALFLAKFFKFLLRFNNLKWVFPLVLSAAVFSLSFYISCNGIAIYTADKVDLTKNIESKYFSEIEALKNDTEKQIKVIKEHIDNVKNNPTEWRDGRRCVLSALQLSEIQDCYNKITELTKEQKTQIAKVQELKNVELSENQSNTANESAKFYKYVAVIMIIQFLTSLALWFFWCKISNEDDPETNQVEAVEKGLRKIEDTVDGCISARVDTKLNILQTVYNHIATESDKRKIAAIKKEPEVKKLKVVGFNAVEESENGVKTSENLTPENASTLGVSAVKNVNLTPSNAININVKVCEHCGKPLTDSQVVRRAKFCSASCRVQHYNETHPERKKITLSTNNLKH